MGGILPRSPRSVSATQVVGVTQNYMQRRNSFGKYTSSPTSDRSPRSSFGQSSDAGSEAAKHSEGMRLAVASALATVLPDVIAAEALGEGRRLGASAREAVTVRGKGGWHFEVLMGDGGLG